VLAIGSYYTSFAEGTSSNRRADHHRFFQKTLALFRLDKPERSVTQVSALLVQCFYLLATSKTDRFVDLVELFRTFSTNAEMTAAGQSSALLFG